MRNLAEINERSRTATKNRFYPECARVPSPTPVSRPSRRASPLQTSAKGMNPENVREITDVEVLGGTVGIPAVPEQSIENMFDDRDKFCVSRSKRPFLSERSSIKRFFSTGEAQRRISGGLGGRGFRALPGAGLRLRAARRAAGRAAGRARAACRGKKLSSK